MVVVWCRSSGNNIILSFSMNLQGCALKWDICKRHFQRTYKNVSPSISFDTHTRYTHTKPQVGTVLRSKNFSPANPYFCCKNSVFARAFLISLKLPNRINVPDIKIFIRCGWTKVFFFGNQEVLSKHKQIHNLFSNC